MTASVNQVIGKVVILYGTVKAVAPDGTVRVLGPNSLVYAGERIITESDGTVSIVLNGPPAGQIDLGRMSDVLLSEDVYAGAEEVTDAVAQAEQIEEAIAGEEDIELEAAAAGGAEGTGTHEIPVFDLDANEVTPTSGAETTGFTYGTVDTLRGVVEGVTANPDSNATQEGLEGSGAATEGNVLDNDISGDEAITVTAVNGSADLVGVPITTDLGGTIIINADGSYSYTPPAQADHSQGPVLDIINYTITNSDGNSASATLTINILDTEPLAVDDTGTATEGASLAVAQLDGVLSNDINSADVPSTVVGVAAGDTGTSAAGAMSVSGQYGILTVAADGSYTYVANASVDAASQDVFTYTIQDDDGDLSHATLTITFEGDNNVPTAQDGAANILESGLRGDGTETVSGTVVFDPGLDTPATLSFDTSTLQYGMATFDTATGAWTYTLTAPVTDMADVAETDFFTYTVTDSDGSTSTGTITITIIDDVPTAFADTGTATEGGTLTVAQLDGVLANDVVGADAPGTVLSVTAGAITVNAGTAITGQYGTLTLAADGSYTYVANASVDAESQDVFTYTMQDADGDPSQATLTITFEGDNNVPTAQDGAASQSDADLFAGTQAASTGSLAFVMGADVPGTVSVSYDSGLGAASQASAGGVTTLTASNWTLTIDEGTGVYAFTQTGAYTHDVGADSDSGIVTVTLTDSDGSEKEVTLTLTIDDMGPTAAISVAGVSVTHDETAGVDSDADDVATASATITAVYGTAGLIGGASSGAAAVVSSSTGGADGLLSEVITLTNSTGGAFTGQDSGLDVTGGNSIYLYTENGFIVGREASTEGTADPAGEVAFVVALESDNSISVAQYQAIEHANITDSDDTASITGNLIYATVVATDGDLDTDSATSSAPIAISFEDDGPSVGNPQDSILSIEQGNQLSAALDVDFGSDGPASTLPIQLVGPEALDSSNSADTTLYAVDNNGDFLTSEGTKLVYQPDGNGGLIAMKADDMTTEVFTVTVDPANGGTYTVEITGILDGTPVSIETSLAAAPGTGGIKPSIDIYTDADGDGTNDILIHMTADDGGTNLVNYSANGTGVGTGASVDSGDTLTLEFLDASDGTTYLNLSSADIGMGSFSPDQDAYWQAYAADGTLVGEGSFSDPTLSGGSNDVTMTVSANLPGYEGTTFSYIKLTAGADGNGYIVTSAASTDMTNAVDHPVTYDFTVTDGDTDTTDGMFTVIFDGDGILDGTVEGIEVIKGSSGAETIYANDGAPDSIDSGGGIDTVLYDGPSIDTLVDPDGNDSVS